MSSALQFVTIFGGTKKSNDRTGLVMLFIYLVFSIQFFTWYKYCFSIL